jgi:DNA mismatch repair protein MutS
MFKCKLKTHILTLACLFSTGYTFTDETPQETTLANHITHRYLTSTFGEEKSVLAPVIDENASFIERLKQNMRKQFDPQKQTLTPRETQKIALDIVAKVSFETTIIDSSYIDKLEIVGGGENSQQHLLGNVFGEIKTATGKAFAAFTLCHPTTDVALLKNRQQSIIQLSNNKKFTHRVNTSFDIIKKNENKSFMFCNTNPPVNPELLKYFYFNLLKQLNTNTAALEINNKFMGTLQLALGTIYIPATTIFQMAAQLNLSYWDAAKWLKSEFIMSPNIPLSVKTTMIGIPVAIQGLSAYSAYMGLKNTGEVANHIQDTLIASASHINELKKLSSLINKNKQLLNNLPSLQPLANFNDSTKHSAKLNKLLRMLDTNTFKGEPSFWSITGRVFAAYELMKQVKDELAPVFAAAGELDMYVALAKLYNSREGKNAQYCMVNFVENSATPVIDAQNFWNPFINPDTVVINNATFDASCPNSILTGPNTGGKSTVIKGIMINVLMAQTFGIAPSSHLTLTPFSKLNCFMNISDDIATGASLFKSEVMRAKKLLDMVQGLQDNEFSFVIIDEVFTGTSPQEGEMAALRFAKTLGSYTNNTSIIATHYPKMVNLHEETNGMFHNHHVEILRNEDGSLNRTFKLKNGPSFFNVAFDILEEEGLFV